MVVDSAACGHAQASMEQSTVQTRWERYRDTLGGELSSAEAISFRIPGWEPVDRDQGFRWLQASIYEGFHVSHKVDWADQAATVTFLIWED
jgi:hypothetical protein